jgi:predicted DNA-binding mobile mystery protein A
MSAPDLRDLHLRQVDQSLRTWREAELSRPPKGGWVRTIRGALGMSTAALARRLGVKPPTVRKFEQAEADGAITLKSLQKLAEALNCEVRYALVPRKPLSEVIHDRAREVAKSNVDPVAHTMALEAQGVSEEHRRQEIEAWARLLLSGPRRDLW